jgi:ammonia channel protein AmtB
MGVLEKPVAGANNKIPEIVYAIYQNMFAAVRAARRGKPQS